MHGHLTVQVAHLGRLEVCPHEVATLRTAQAQAELASLQAELRSVSPAEKAALVEEINDQGFAIDTLMESQAQVQKSLQACRTRAHDVQI